VWTPADGLEGAHQKAYLPDEGEFWEASWYERGPGDFTVVDVAGLKVGFLICTELWFTRHARDYARSGVHVVASPRATPLASLDKWIAGGRAAAVVAGAYGLSSNRAGVSATGMAWGGAGWVVDPDGDLLARTNTEQPFVTVDLDPLVAERAKQTYPRYVRDLP
jgi:N-carbamoylputrescine amidase